ncbi:MAG: TlpA family protein disulfide reductase [Deltaproteobacteria bacterium]|nr:TlpA family protein disulfide reductase [Deltaproteobacteria bacterium]
MGIRVALLLLALAWLVPRAHADTLPVGSRAELFTLKVANPDAVDKRILSLNQLVGEGAATPKKLVLISFFATYCEPCKKELPFLQLLQERYADKGLGILVVSIDKDKDVPGGAAEAVAKIGAEKKLTYPILHDRFNIVAKRYGVEKLPCLYLIDGAGNVALTNVGYTEEFTEALTKEVQTRLGVPLEKIELAATGGAPKTKPKKVPKGKKK